MTRAAAACHVSQPALSRQLADLERELGCELFVRGSRGVHLTDEGVLLRNRAQEIVELADRVELELRSDGAQIEGDIWIGAGESRAFSMLAAAMAQLEDAHPAVRLHLYSGNYEDVTDRIDKGLLDFGLLMGSDTDTRFESMPLPWKDRWGVLMRDDHPLARRPSLTLADLKGERLIVSAQRHEEAPGNDMHVVATYTLLYNASLLVDQGVGVAICLDGIVRAGEGSPFAFVALEDAPEVESRLVWKRFQPLSRAARAFLRILQSQL